jgi:regulatory protein
VWHKKGVKARRPLVPLDGKSLHQLALRYVGRFATTRAKLRAYLARKVRERGWDEGTEPDLEALAERFAALGYVDDAGYAMAKSRALTGRGFGKRRVVQALHIAGIGEDDGEAARRHADAEAVAAALRFAERRRIGPFAAAAITDPKERQKALAAMTRAGHGFGLARAIVELRPGAPIDHEELAERFGTSGA